MKRKKKLQLKGSDFIVALGLFFVLSMGMLLFGYADVSAMTLDNTWELENSVPADFAVNADGSVTIRTASGTIDGGAGMKNTLYYPLPNATDYVFTVKVSGNFSADYHGAHLGIASGRDRANAVAVVRRRHGYLSGDYGSNQLFGMMQNGGSPSEMYESNTTMGSDFYLRLQKNNGRITGYYAKNYSADIADWNQIIDDSSRMPSGPVDSIDKGSALIAPENIYLLIAAANGGGSTATQITFSDLRVNGEAVPFGADLSTLASISLSGATEIDVDDVIPLTLNGKDYSDNTITTFDSVVYTSSDPDVATVAADGTVKGVDNGNVVITAVATKGGVTRTATIAIKVGEIVTERTWELASPDGNTTIKVEMITGGILQYSAKQNGIENIGTSPLGLVTSLGDFSKNLVVKEVSQVKEINESYKVLSGKSDKYTNHCKEQTITFTRKDNAAVEFDLVIRAYNDGTAYRYAIRTGDEVKDINISDETSGLQLPAGAAVYWMNYANAQWNYESEYQVTTAEGLPVGSYPSMPLLYGKDGVWTLFSEADLNGTFCGSMFTAKGSGLLDVSFARLQSTAVTTKTPFKSPWRAAITGTLENVIENTMIENLSTPADHDTYDFESWVDPGLSSWSWVTNWGSGVSDQSKAETHLNWIEFGGEIGWDYYILDEGWNLGGRGNVSGMREWWPEVKACAEENGVKLWAWVHVSDIDTQEERDRHFSAWSSQGIVGIKPDFFDGESQRIMQIYDDLYKDAARYNLMVLAHGANKPTGEVRTWPNVYGREAIKGQEAGGITANQYTMIPFIRAAIGPAEVTEEVRSKDSSKTTMGFQFALTALVEDGIHSMGSAPNVYRGIPEAMSYYKNYPKKWDETQYVAGEVGEDVSIARRTGDEWYVSGISVNPQTMKVPLTCLKADTEYTVLLYKENTRTNIQMEIIRGVTSETELDIDVLSGGGYALRAVPLEALNLKAIIAAPTRVTVEAGRFADEPVAVTFNPADTEFKDVEWSSADESIATVSQGGLVRGVSAGRTKLTVASAFDPTIKAEVNVVVTPARYVLDSDVWNIVRGNDNVLVNDTDSVTITTERGVLGSDNWNNMFSMDVPAGDIDFTITAKISGGALNADYQGAFITIFGKGSPNSPALAVGRRYHGGMSLGASGARGFGVMSTTGGTSEFYDYDYDYNDDAYVKIEKTGNTFTGYYSYDGENWSQITNKGTIQTTTNATLAARTDLCVGFYAGSGGSSVATDVTISEFTYNGVNVPLAVDNGVYVPDKSILAELVGKAGIIQKDSYTDESWQKFAEALAEANRVIAATDVTDFEVDDTLEDLLFAIAGLKNKNVTVDKSGLQTVYNLFANVKKQNYTDVSWNNYQNALTEAAAVLANKNATAAQVNAAISKLINASNALTEKASGITKGKVYTVKNIKYKVLSAAKGKETVSVVGASKKTVKTVTIPATVKINGVKCKVTEVGAKAFKNYKKLGKVTIGANVKKIGKEAFSGCKKLKTITIKSKVLTKVGSKAFKNIHAKATIKVPKAKKSAYTKLLSKKGQKSTVKIK